MKTLILISVSLFMLLDSNEPKKAPMVSEVVFKNVQDDFCAYADVSYRFKIYEDGDYFKTVGFTYNNTTKKWHADGCAMPDYSLCRDCSISKAVKIYYTEKLERSAGSISVEL